MSSEVNTSTDLRNCPRMAESTREDMDPEDLGKTQSSILYLLQEATKLVTPPKPQSLVAEKLHDCTKKNVSHNSTSLMQKDPEIRTVKTGPSFRGTFSMLSSSPWDVMSLINLQCERLLHSGGTNKEQEDSHRDKMKVYTKSEDRDAEHEWFSFPSAVSTSIISLRANAMEHSMESDVCCTIPDTIDPNDHLTVEGFPENDEGATTEDVEDLAVHISKTTAESLLSCKVMSEEMIDRHVLVETPVLPLDLRKKVEICEHTKESCGGINEMASILMISEASQRPEISSVDFTSSLVAEKYEDQCFFLNNGDNEVCETPIMSEMPPLKTDLNNNLEDATLQEAKKSPSAMSSQLRCGNRRRMPRKQAHPVRSPDLLDPVLQGVTFSMQTELDHSTDQCHLLITSNYRRGRRSRSCRPRSIQNSQRTSSSEEESDSTNQGKKICASCCTRKTPLWRDAEDGTPLCNACGIRYKKYRVRCLQCWNIPRKEASSNSKCLKCGDLLQPASQNKRPGW